MTVQVCPTCDIAGCIHIRERAAGPRLTFAPQAYPGGRILLMLGNVQIGAVFPPPNVTTLHRPVWLWRFWLACGACPEGKAKTEQAAKNALLAKARDWIRKAGIDG